MIVGKNSVKLGFSWYGKTIIKCMAGVAIIGLSIPNYAFLAVFGLIAIILGVYESWKEYKVLSAKTPTIKGDYKHNVSKDDDSGNFIANGSKDDYEDK